MRILLPAQKSAGGADRVEGHAREGGDVSGDFAEHLGRRGGRDLDPEDPRQAPQDFQVRQRFPERRHSRLDPLDTPLDVREGPLLLGVYGRGEDSVGQDRRVAGPRSLISDELDSAERFPDAALFQGRREVVMKDVQEPDPPFRTVPHHGVESRAIEAHRLGAA